MVIDSGKRHPDEICADLSISPALIEAFFNLPAGQLTSRLPEETVTTLK
jgi:hypothetical protein